MINKPNEPLNLYQQESVSSPVQIVGTKQSLQRLIEILQRAIDSHVAIDNFYSNAIEAYELQVLCLPTMFDEENPQETFDPTWSVVQLPYDEDGVTHHPSYLITTHPSYEALSNKTDEESHANPE